MDTKHKCEDTCIDHWENSELTCPYCLYEESDSWEVLRGDGNESGKTNCSECDKEYNYGTTITYADGGVSTIYYTTTPIEAQ